MRHSILISTFLIGVLVSASLYSQIIHIPYSPKPTIDGVFHQTEWAGANSKSIQIGSTNNVVDVYFMHDSTTLFFAYAGNLASSNLRFPELMLDIEYDRTSNWNSDDWWFHVSATDCESNGQPSNYDSCAVTRPNWTAMNNFPTGGPGGPDTIEISIPFSTVGLDLSIHDSIGISLEVTNTFNAWDYWPIGADINSPSTWGTAVFLNKISAVNEFKKQKSFFEIHPNPSKGTITLNTKDAKTCELLIFNIHGELISHEVMNANKFQYTFPDNAKNGMYLIHLIKDDELQKARVILER